MLLISIKKNPGICLTAEEKARKNLSQRSRRMPVGTMKYLTKGDQWKESQSVTVAYVCDRGYMFCPDGRGECEGTLPTL